MNLIRGLTLGVILLSLANLAAGAGGGKKAQELLVGKWMGEARDKDIVSITLEFFKDGNYKATTKAGDVNESVKGTYKLIDDTTLELAPAVEKEKPRRVKIENLTAETLILILPLPADRKDRIEFKRAR